VGLPGSEATIRGFSAVALLRVDQAARVSDDLYVAIRPMLAVSGGKLWLMSTPSGITATPCKTVAGKRRNQFGFPVLGADSGVESRPGSAAERVPSTTSLRTWRTGIILWDEVLQLEDQPAQVADHAESPKSAEARLGGHCRLHEFRAICIECKDCGLGGAIRATATGL